jgi:hypothetical protein
MDITPDRWQVLADIAYGLDFNRFERNAVAALDAVIAAFPIPQDPKADFEGYAVGRFARTLREELFRGAEERHCDDAADAQIDRVKTLLARQGWTLVNGDDEVPF